MTPTNKYLDRLKALRLQYPVQALENPGSITGEIFGVHVGVMKGLKMAENLFNEVLEEQAGKKE